MREITIFEIPIYRQKKVEYSYKNLEGFINVNLSAQDVFFEMFYEENFSHQIWTGQHFNHMSMKTNREILTDLEGWLNNYKSDSTFIQNGWVLDLRAFNNVKNYIDFLQIIKSIKAKNL